MLNKHQLEIISREGTKLNIPQNKKRALIREYLQSKIIYYIYEQKKSNKLSFIGGTSLRILRNLDRFSEDLDFDNLGLTFGEIKKIISDALKNLEKEGFKTEFSFKKTDNSGIGAVKFLNLLYQLEISGHKEEKLLIKIDYSTPKIKPVTEVIILRRFGVIQTVISNSDDFILSQKARAILTRKEILPRDFYDLVWLLSHHAEPHPKLFKELKVKSKQELFEKIIAKYQIIKPKLKVFKERLKPFLINEKNIKYLDLIENLLK